MLLRVDKGKIRKLDLYRNLIKPELYEEIQNLAAKSEGLRVTHLNATPKGGGVSVLLKYLVPLMKGVGIKAEWRVVPPNIKFFSITKQLHNALQGKKYELSFKEKKYYIEYNQQLADWMNHMKCDVLVVHDPQPLAVIDFLEENRRKNISRFHIDTSTPDPGIMQFVLGFLRKYDRIIFSMEEFVPSGIDREKVRIFHPAIDPLSAQNRPIRLKNIKSTLSGIGIDCERPIITWVGRFDPWKDPMGVVDTYHIAKEKIHGLQLVMSGLFLAQDDPESVEIFHQVKDYAGDDPDIHLFSDINQLGPIRIGMFINILQTAADVVLQKSTREGFGLVVAEAMWKGKAVVGGMAGGIKLQIEDGKSGYLVRSKEEAAERIVTLMKDKDLRERMGAEAKKRVGERFLLPRLLRDYLKLFVEFL